MSLTNIITVTLSPSLDRTVTTRYLNVGYHNPITGTTRLDPAGGGVSISRALHQLNCPTHAIVLLQDDSIGTAYESLLQKEGFPTTVLKISGHTRSDTIIRDSANEQETRLVDACAPLTAETLAAVEQAIRTLINNNGDDQQVVVFAGTLPEGSPDTSYSSLINVAHELGAETAVALERQNLDGAIAAKPTLLALTQLQTEALFNFPVRSLKDVAYCAREIRSKGVNRVLIEMAEQGAAFLTTSEEEWLIDFPDVHEGTRSGIWEALLAGFLAGRQRKRPLPEALSLGGAAAAYTASQIGSEFGTSRTVNDYLDKVEIAPISAEQEDTNDV